MSLFTINCVSRHRRSADNLLLSHDVLHQMVINGACGSINLAIAHVYYCHNNWFCISIMCVRCQVKVTTTGSVSVLCMWGVKWKSQRLVLYQNYVCAVSSESHNDWFCIRIMYVRCQVKVTTTGSVSVLCMWGVKWKSQRLVLYQYYVCAVSSESHNDWFCISIMYVRCQVKVTTTGSVSVLCMWGVKWKSQRLVLYQNYVCAVSSESHNDWFCIRIMYVRCQVKVTTTGSVSVLCMWGVKWKSQRLVLYQYYVCAVSSESHNDWFCIRIMYVRCQVKVTTTGSVSVLCMWDVKWKSQRLVLYQYYVCEVSSESHNNWFCISIIYVRCQVKVTTTGSVSVLCMWGVKWKSQRLVLYQYYVCEVLSESHNDWFCIRIMYVRCQVKVTTTGSVSELYMWGVKWKSQRLVLYQYYVCEVSSESHNDWFCISIMYVRCQVKVTTTGSVSVLCMWDVKWKSQRLVLYQYYICEVSSESHNDWFCISIIYVRCQVKVTTTGSVSVLCMWGVKWKSQRLVLYQYYVCEVSSESHNDWFCISIMYVRCQVKVTTTGSVSVLCMWDVKWKSQRLVLYQYYVCEVSSESHNNWFCISIMYVRCQVKVTTTGSVSVLCMWGVKWKSQRLVLYQYYVCEVSSESHNNWFCISIMYVRCQVKVTTTGSVSVLCMWGVKWKSQRLVLYQYYVCEVSSESHNNWFCISIIYVRCQVKVTTTGSVSVLCMWDVKWKSQQLVLYQYYICEVSSESHNDWFCISIMYVRCQVKVTTTGSVSVLCMWGVKWKSQRLVLYQYYVCEMSSESHNNWFCISIIYVRCQVKVTTTGSVSVLCMCGVKWKSQRLVLYQYYVCEMSSESHNDWFCISIIYMRCQVKVTTTGSVSVLCMWGVKWKSQRLVLYQYYVCEMSSESHNDWFCISIMYVRCQVKVTTTGSVSVLYMWRVKWKSQRLVLYQYYVCEVLSESHNDWFCISIMYVRCQVKVTTTGSVSVLYMWRVKWKSQRLVLYQYYVCEVSSESHNEWFCISIIYVTCQVKVTTTGSGGKHNLYLAACYSQTRLHVKKHFKSVN